MKKYIFLFAAFLSIVIVSLPLNAQNPPSSGFKPGKGAGREKKATLPESPQEKEERMRKEAKKSEKEKAGKDNKQDPDKPLSDRQKRRKMKRDEKDRRKAYYAHQNRIQEPEVRYRMTKNEKKAKRYNRKKHAPWWRRIQFNYRKKKHRKKK